MNVQQQNNLIHGALAVAIIILLILEKVAQWTQYTKTLTKPSSQSSVN